MIFQANYFFLTKNNNKIKANFNGTLALRVLKSDEADLRVYLSFSNFTIITLPTSQYYLGRPIDISINQMDFTLLIESWVYRNDFYYGSRQIYFGIFLKICFTLSTKYYF